MIIKDENTVNAAIEHVNKSERTELALFIAPPKTSDFFESYKFFITKETIMEEMKKNNSNLSSHNFSTELFSEENLKVVSQFVKEGIIITFENNEQLAANIEKFLKGIKTCKGLTINGFEFSDEKQNSSIAEIIAHFIKTSNLKKLRLFQTSFGEENNYKIVSAINSSHINSLMMDNFLKREELYGLIKILEGNETIRTLYFNYKAETPTENFQDNIKIIEAPYHQLLKVCNESNFTLQNIYVCDEEMYNNWGNRFFNVLSGHFKRIGERNSQIVELKAEETNSEKNLKEIAETKGEPQERKLESFRNYAERACASSIYLDF
ncbi:MAG: hypothetical protein J0H68_02210 [Sphingobacteriia bacterium]|nr:hypothetical protein [Sphingobacteriia bacterium]